MPRDHLNAFVDPDLQIAGAAQGPLSGLRFAIKDIFDVAGHKAGCGNPDWLATHPAAAATAPVVTALLEAGATAQGKTITEEIAYSMVGENAHYGTPVNSRCPDRIPGGSSSGSVSAVAGEAVDFALGSDTGGSVRIPASFCGVYGIRPSHGRISLECVMPLAPSFDTVGWFARSAALLAQVGEVLLGAPPPRSPRRFLFAEDVWAKADGDVQAALRPLLRRLPDTKSANVYGGAEAAWLDAFRTLQAAEVWQAHSAWVQQAKPRFGPGIRQRFEFAATVTADQVAKADPVRRQVSDRMAALLADDAVLVMPTTPCPAAPRNSGADVLDALRNRTLTLTCIAGLARLPEVTLPLAEVGGCPVGLSLVAAHGNDEMLLQFARQLAG